MKYLQLAAYLCVSVTFVAGCANSQSPELLPGIHSGTRLVELTPDQNRTLAEWTRDQFGGAEPTTLECADGIPYTFASVDIWLEDFGNLPDTCPTLVDSEMNFIIHLTDHCHDPGFDSSDYVGHRGCSGP